MRFLDSSLAAMRFGAEREQRNFGWQSSSRNRKCMLIATVAPGFDSGQSIVYTSSTSPTWICLQSLLGGCRVQPGPQAAICTNFSPIYARNRSKPGNHSIERFVSECGFVSLTRKRGFLVMIFFVKVSVSDWKLLVENQCEKSVASV